MNAAHRRRRASTAAFFAAAAIGIPGAAALTGGPVHAQEVGGRAAAPLPMPPRSRGLAEEVL
ncbi:MAG TPA: hypothetical protein VE684_15810 [Crenalkalicoccus sp.]|jgi:hypothetical protein|nr:hypothetical protein [Crenalkalicoccus sp.]